MTGWPTLDGPDAERAIRDATAVVWTWEEGASAESIVAALNDADVVLCDHTALAALRRPPSFDQVMAWVDLIWPEDVWNTLPEDDPSKDCGHRVVSLVRRLAALRQRAIDAEALIDELRAERSHDDESRLVCLDWHLDRHGLTADSKDGTR